MSEKKYNFFNPVFAAGKPIKAAEQFAINQAGSVIKNFPFNLGKLDELATDFGMVALKGAILKNTLKIYNAPAKPLGPPMPTSSQQAPNFPDTQSSPNDTFLTVLHKSALGFPVYSNLSILAGNYQNNQGDTIGDFDEVSIDACLFELTRENNVIETDIQGRDNSVIEYISSKSWKINCKGRILSSTRNAYPFNEVNNLKIALNSNRSLRIQSFFLGMMEIYNIVIKKKSFPQEEGSLEYQKFEFDAIADNPVILKRSK